MSGHARHDVRRWRLTVAILFSTSLGPDLPRDTLAQASPPARCGVGLPQGEQSGYTPLPRGDVFCPLIADPRAIRSFASWQRGSSARLTTALASVGIGDFVGLARWGSRRPGDGVQVSLNAGVFAQFDLRSKSFDLLNADYLIGLPITARRGDFSARLRFYHQSSHLGDEFLLRATGEGMTRENLSFESAELLLSVDGGLLRAYGGGEYLVHRGPRALAPAVAHMGAEMRQRGTLLRIGSIATLHFVAGVDLRVTAERRESAATSARAGVQLARPGDRELPTRRWSLMGEWYDGPSPYGQFYRDRLRYYGLGVHFTP